jgi:hypothetical protein
MTKKRLNNWTEDLQNAANLPKEGREAVWEDPWAVVCLNCVLDECVQEWNRRCLIAIARRYGLMAEEAEALVKITIEQAQGILYYTNLVIGQAEAGPEEMERGNDDVRSVV